MRFLMGISIALAFGALVHAEPLHVPPPPAPPPPRAFLGDLMDNMLLGGAIQSTRASERYTEAESYRIRLKAFMDALTPEQKAELWANDHESKVLIAGVVYIQGARNSVATQSRPSPTAVSAPLIQGQGQKVYSPSECIGAIVNGVCHGSILPQSAYHPTCHGEMLNGMCTGPMF
jgi:hypothetical protein